MRPYANNSPQAAARFVALAMVADGDLCMAEVGVLDRLGAHEQLGPEAEQIHVVVHEHHAGSPCLHPMSMNCWNPCCTASTSR